MSDEQTTETQVTGRQGLVGAMPVGERWRAQGYIGGQTKYLGTFDTEEEAHQVFTRAKAAHQTAQEDAAREAVEKILDSPTFEYRGGVGRGATHNGRRFKVVEAKGPHHSQVAPLGADGVPDFRNQATVLTACLYEVAEAPPVAAPQTREAAAAPPLSEQTLDTMKSDVLRFASHEGLLDMSWALEFAWRHARKDDLQQTLAVLLGKASVADCLEWLRVNTTIPSNIVDEVTTDALSGVFVDENLLREAAALDSAFGTNHKARLDDLKSAPSLYAGVKFEG